jgi:hypothetical protein
MCDGVVASPLARGSGALAAIEMSLSGRRQYEERDFSAALRDDWQAFVHLAPRRRRS